MTIDPPQTAPRRARERVSSLLLVNTGDGKGKTTSALGTAMRAVAMGWRVCVIQFMKSGRWKVGEEKAGRDLGMEWWALGDGFTWESADMDETQAKALAAWAAAVEKIRSGDYQLVVLDEVTYPIVYGWLDESVVAGTLRSRPEHVSVILTGRNAPDALIEIADTVSEVRNVKHAFDRGVKALQGIDF